MNELALWRVESVPNALFAYAIVCIFALGFDLLTDRSFDALMLATLPISVIALGCLIVGPWLNGNSQTGAKIGWVIGAVLIFLTSIAFALLGAEQAKTGEVIFTYAVIVLALPGSLALPFFEAFFFTGSAFENVFLRIGSAWSVCFAIGWIEWTAVGSLRSNMRRHRLGD